MIRFIAQILARWNYIFTLEFESAKSEVNARLAERNTNEKRKLFARLNQEANDIEASIKSVEAEEEKRKNSLENTALTPQEKYEDERAATKERQDAENMVAEKRRIAAEHEKDISGGEETVKHLRTLADNGRNVADKIRKL
jgi:hypothetical protein